MTPCIWRPSSGKKLNIALGSEYKVKNPQSVNNPFFCVKYKTIVTKGRAESKNGM